MYVSCMITSTLLQRTFNDNLELAYDLEQAKKHAEGMASTDALKGPNNRHVFFDKAGYYLPIANAVKNPLAH